jgi:hypothetical protein
MRILRWLGAGLVATVGGLLGLVGVVLSVTVILLPLGIPVIMLARRMFGLATSMVVPRAVRHPVSELDRRGSKAGKQARSATGDTAKKATRSGRRAGRKGAAALKDAAPGRKDARRFRRKVERKTGRRNRLGLRTG